MKSHNTKKLGAFGERIALNYLRNKGYKILDQNYSPKFVSGPQRGEIDIIAKPGRNIFNIFQGKKDDVIHFIEVKTLTANINFSRQNFGGPEEKVDYLKQRKIIKAAENWLMEKKIPLDSKWQIDVISIKIDLNSKKAKIKYFKNIGA